LRDSQIVLRDRQTIVRDTQMLFRDTRKNLRDARKNLGDGILLPVLVQGSFRRAVAEDNRAAAGES